MKALLVIDMQKVSFTAETPRYDSEGLIQRLNLIADQFRKRGEPVIFVQHDGSSQGYCIPNTKEWELLDELISKSSDVFITKTANDAFFQSKLKDFLSDLAVDELVIGGCATDFCVDATVKSAIARNYQVTVLADGHTTADRPGIKARQVMDYFNWIWSEMTPINGKIQTIKTLDYLEKIA